MTANTYGIASPAELYHLDQLALELAKVLPGVDFTVSIPGPGGRYVSNPEGNAHFEVTNL